MGMTRIHPESYEISFGQVKFPEYVSDNLAASFERIFSIYNNMTILTSAGSSLKNILKQSLVGSMVVSESLPEFSDFFLVRNNVNATTVVHIPINDRYSDIKTSIRDNSAFFLDNGNLDKFSFLTLLKMPVVTENEDCFETEKRFIHYNIQNKNYSDSLCEIRCDKRLSISCSEFAGQNFCNLTLNTLRYLHIWTDKESFESNSTITTKHSSDTNTKIQIFTDRKSLEIDLIHLPILANEVDSTLVLFRQNVERYSETNQGILYLLHLMLEMRRRHLKQESTFYHTIIFNGYDHLMTEQYPTTVSKYDTIDGIYTLSVHGCTKNSIQRTQFTLTLENQQYVFFEDIAKKLIRLPSRKLTKLNRLHQLKNYDVISRLDFSNPSKPSFITARHNNGQYVGLFVQAKPESRSIPLNFTFESNSTVITPVSPSATYIDNSVLNWKIETFSGQHDAPDLVTFSCQLMSIDGMGGTLQGYDQILVPFNTICNTRRVHKIFSTNYTKIINKARVGVFWYIVKNQTTNDVLISIDNSKMTKHVIYIPCNLRDSEQVSTASNNDKLFLIDITCDKTRVQIGFDVSFQNIIFNFQDHFYTIIGGIDEYIGIFFKRGIVDKGDLNLNHNFGNKENKVGLFADQNRVAETTGNYIIYLDKILQHMTIFTHNGKSSNMVANVDSGCNTLVMRPPKILTIIRHHPEYTTLISVNGQYTSIDFDRLCQNTKIRSFSIYCHMRTILVQNLIQGDRLLYLNLKEPCWQLKEMSDELDVKLTFDGNILSIDLYLTRKSGQQQKIGSILIMQPGRQVHIYIALEFTMSVVMKHGLASLQANPSLVPLATNIVLLQPESCYREIWLVFDQRQILTIDQFKFGDSLILVASCLKVNQEPVSIFLLDYFSTSSRYFPVFTFESVGRTWRMRRLIY